MPEPYAILPFPLGKTYTQGAVDPTSTTGVDVQGRLYRIPNPSNPSKELVLGVARYTGSSNLTAAAKCVKFTAGKLGMEFAGFVDANGGVGKPLDPWLAGQTVKPNDLVYYIEAGEVTVDKATGSTVIPGQILYSGNAGAINGSLTGGYPIGVATANAASDATTVGVDVLGGFRT